MMKIEQYFKTIRKRKDTTDVDITSSNKKTHRVGQILSVPSPAKSNERTGSRSSLLPTSLPSPPPSLSTTDENNLVDNSYDREKEDANETFDDDCLPNEQDEREQERLYDASSITHDTSITHDANERLRRFLFSTKACPVSRRILQPFRDRAPAVVQKFFIDPRSEWYKYTRKHEIRNHAGIYAIVNSNDDDDEIIKIGYTKDFVVRRKYCVEDGTPPYCFVVILDVDMIDDETSTRLHQLCKEAQDALLTSHDLHPCQKHFYRQQFEREGARLGFQTTFALALLEAGYQKEFGGIECAMEFLAFDRDKCNALYQDCADWALKLYRSMPSRLREAGLAGTLKILIISSWAVGGRHKYICAKIIMNQAIAGSEWRDTLPNPMFPDATTPEQMYCCDFPIEERRKAREQRLYPWLTEYLESNDPCVILLDTNALLFDNDPYCEYDSVHQMLQHKYRMQRQEFHFGNNELVPYLDAKQMHSVITNRPFCRACDSRPFVTLLQKLERTRTVATEMNFVRLLRGKQPLDAYHPDDEFENPLNGFISSMMLHMGGKSNGKRCARFFLDSCTKMNVNPLVQTTMPKLPSMEASVSKFLRKQAGRKPRTPSSSSSSSSSSSLQHEYDRRLGIEFQAIICQSRHGTTASQEEEEVYDKLWQRAAQGIDGTDTRRARMKNILFKRVLLDDDNHENPLADALHALYDANRDNIGNDRAFGISDEQILTNNTILTEFVRAHAESKTRQATPFWIRLLENTEPQTSHVAFGTKYQVLDMLTFHGLENRTIYRVQSHAGSNRVAAVKFTDLGLNKVQPEQIHRGYVLVRLLPRKNRIRSKEQAESEYQDLLVKHPGIRPTRDRRTGDPFWIKIKLSTKELYDADFVVDEDNNDDEDNHDDDSYRVFPAGLTIYNGHVWSSLSGKYKRARKKHGKTESFGITRIKRSPAKNDYIECHGYYKIELTFCGSVGIGVGVGSVGGS